VRKNGKESPKKRDAASNEIRCVKPNRANTMNPTMHNEPHETAPGVTMHGVLHNECKTCNTTTNMIDEQGIVEHEAPKIQCISKMCGEKVVCDSKIKLDEAPKTSGDKDVHSGKVEPEASEW
jgi:hypothetical protein